MAVVHPDQAFLCGELLALHLAQRHVIQRKYAKFGVHHLFVEFAVPVIQLPELSVRFHLCFKFRLRLCFEHGNLLSGRYYGAAPGNVGRRLAGDGRGTCRENTPTKLEGVELSDLGNFSEERLVLKCCTQKHERPGWLQRGAFWIRAETTRTRLSWVRSPGPARPPPSLLAAAIFGLSNGSSINRSPATWDKEFKPSGYLDPTLVACLPQAVVTKPLEAFDT